MVDEKFKTDDGRFMLGIIKDLKYNRLSGTEGNKRGFQKIVDIIKENGHEPEIQEFQCSDFPINVMFRINGLILALLFTLTWMALSFQSPIILLNLSIITLIFTLMSEKITSYSFGRFRGLGKKIECKNATWVVEPTEEVKCKVIFGGHHDSKSQTFRVMIRAAIMIATTITLIIFSIQMILNALFLIFGPFLWKTSAPLPSIYSMIWTYFITLIILINGYGNKSPGANDNLTAVACVIQLANEFKKNPPKHVEIHFLINDAEEMGLYGAQEWYDRKKSILDRKNTFFVIYDTIGDAPLLNLASFGIPPRVISKRFQAIIKEAQDQGKVSSLKKMYLPIGAATDHIIFDRNGYDTLVITSLCKRVHTSKNSAEYLKEQPMLLAKETGKAIVEVIDSGFTHK